ncbi:MAG TPA: hypothetical protein ENG63_03850 [Candidatus Desulfofervidus auxilii]|uniref:Uncharacterized protein n=1 Tax=Desulfofervidus auxilii TaxID=1621989 RepID=A0A7C0Y454_DESA2|nr:hypothetical protein [Candidatus Desulfofervidus auxilii]
MPKSIILAENQNWRIRAAIDSKNESYAITNSIGRFTFYLYGKSEKIAFYNTLKRVYEEIKNDDLSNLYFFAFGGWFGIWLTKEDIVFFLENLPFSETEEQIKMEEEIVQRVSKYEIKKENNEK